MNKYLEKVAQLHLLEEGVNWDDGTKTLKVSRAREQHAIKTRQNLYAIPVAAEIGFFGGVAGTLLGEKYSRGIFARKNLGMKLGAGAGALLGTYGGYHFGKATAKRDPDIARTAKESLYEKLERKHEPTIHSIEGWDKI